MTRYKIGDKVRVIKDICGHQFEIGEVITLDEKHRDGGWYCVNQKTDIWFLREEEFEHTGDLKQTEEMLLHILV